MIDWNPILLVGVGALAGQLSEIVKWWYGKDERRRERLETFVERAFDALGQMEHWQSQVIEAGSARELSPVPDWANRLVALTSLHCPTLRADAKELSAAADSVALESIRLWQAHHAGERGTEQYQQIEAQRLAATGKMVRLAAELSDKLASHAAKGS